MAALISQKDRDGGDADEAVREEGGEAEMMGRRAKYLSVIEVRVDFYYGVCMTKVGELSLSDTEYTALCV